MAQRNSQVLVPLLAAFVLGSCSSSPSPTASGPTVEQLEALASMDLSKVSAAWSGFTYTYPGRLPVVDIGEGYLRINEASYEQHFPGTELTFYGTTDDLCIQYSGTAASATGDREITVHVSGEVGQTPEAGPCPQSLVDAGTIEMPTLVEEGPYKFAEVYPGVGTCFTEGEAVFPGRVDAQPAWIVEECDAGDTQICIVASELIEDNDFQADLGEDYATKVCSEAWVTAAEAGFTASGFFLPDERYWAHGMRHYLCFARVPTP